MEYISTRNNKKIFSFKEVFLKGLAPDGGLFIPKKIPFYKHEELDKFRKFSYQELAAKIIFEFCSQEFKRDEIQNLVNNSYKEFRVNNVVAIKRLKKINLLELFHGPTLAFKDIAMQVIGNMYDHLQVASDKKVNIVVATSGDTGSAAIAALNDRKNINVFDIAGHES